MENKKKLFLEIIFLVLVFCGTAYGVFYGKDPKEIIQIIGEVNKLYLIPAVLCVVFFIWSESIIIHYLLGTQNYHLKKRHCFLFSAVGFFFSCITPSASGGQPAQICYMKREKVPIPVSTIVLMIVTITYKAVLIIFGVGIIIFGQKFMNIYLGDILPVFYLGIILNVICVGIMLLMVFRTDIARVLANKLLAVLEKLHILKYKESRHIRLESAMEKYHETATYFQNHGYDIVNVLFITFAQRLSLFLSTYFVYRAFGLDEYSAGTIILLQAVISISVDMLPLPGGMGISETLFLSIFLPVFGEMFILPGMILSRGLSYYTELFLCAFITLLAHFVFKKKKECH